MLPSGLHIWGHPHQNSIWHFILYQNGLFAEKEKFDPKMFMELQGIPNSLNNIEKEQSWKTHISQFQKLHGYSNQNNAVLPY